MSRREGVFIVVLVLVSVAFVLYYLSQQQPEGVGLGSIPRAGTALAPAQPSVPAAPSETSERTIGRDTRLIEQGQFYILSFTLLRPRDVTVSVSLKSGAAIDSYLVGEDGLNAWQAMAANHQSLQFQYFPSLTMAPLAGDYVRTARLPPGKYALIIDNSPLGATAPPFHLFKRTPALVSYSVSAAN
jgi:hypothetical protein